MQIDTTSIINKFKHLKPEKIILFGSYAKGNPDPDSDVDVLVIQKTQKKRDKSRNAHHNQCKSDCFFSRRPVDVF